jgi:aminoglycoside 3-N-acetyltransferase
MKAGKRVWTTCDEINFSGDDFLEIGESFEAISPVRTGRIGNAKAKLINQKQLVDYAVLWMETNRT